MKLLVFAHTPPPHHGQSYMVKLMLDGLGGDARSAENRIPGGPIECYHVNCRVSEKMEDIGEVRPGKLLLLLRYCLEAIWCRFRYGIETFYYIPAPGKRAALYRDWVVLFFCRPFFKKLVLHWHAVGLGDWLKQEGNWFERWLTRWLFARTTLGVALAIPSMRDALWCRSQRVEIVPNGIPDPCPDFEECILPSRRARTAARRALLNAQPSDNAANADNAASPQAAGVPPMQVLFLAHCTREKGVFDALEGTALFNQDNAASGLQVHLTVAGAFMDEREEREFRSRIKEPDLAGAVTYAGFIAGETKTKLLTESDCLCFPTYYSAESFGLVILEAMAFGIPSVTTRWRAIPELLPADYPGYVAPQAPEEVAETLKRIATVDLAAVLRARFLGDFTIPRHLEKLSRAIASV